jgi:predicted esterase YcpF (UPF0227 family)
MKDRLNIIYIHGFASSGNSTKAMELRDIYNKTTTVIHAPDLPVDPKQAMRLLFNLVDSIPEDEAIIAVGTSLGGFYAMCLNADCGIPVFVMNPLVDSQSMENKIGKCANLNTGEAFEFKREYLQTLREMTTDLFKSYHRNVHIFLTKDDEVLPYMDTVNAVNGTACDLQVFPSGGHRFEQFKSRFNKYMKPVIDKYVLEGKATPTLYL